jgi:hypothetical protein
MSVTIATIPSPALGGKTCKLALTASTGNFVKVWCTNAPVGSKLRKALDDSGASRVIVLGGVDSESQTDFTPDKGGGYVFVLEEFEKGAAAYGGGYLGDPNAAPAEELLSTTTTTVYFASQLTCKIGVAGDTAELLLYVNDDQIIVTTEKDHGVLSPAIRNPVTPKARLSAELTTVRAAVADLAGTATTTLGDLGDEIDAFISVYNAHLVESGVHDANDTDNAITASFLGAENPEGQKRALARIRDALDHHIRTDNPNATPTGTGTGDYHDTGSVVADLSNLLLNAQPSSDIAGLFSSFADAIRAYEAHRVSGVHDSADATNTFTATAPLLLLHIAFNEQLAKYTPTTPPNEHSAKALLINGGGFKEA